MSGSLIRSSSSTRSTAVIDAERTSGARCPTGMPSAAADAQRVAVRREALVVGEGEHRRGHPGEGDVVGAGDRRSLQERVAR